MKLGQLKQIINTYDQTAYLRKYFIGDHERAKLIKEFVNDINELDTYILSAKEEFTLAELLSPLNDDIEVVKQTKNLFNNPSLFFKLFAQLDKKQLIDQDNFSSIHNLNREKLVFFLEKMQYGLIIREQNFTKPVLNLLILALNRSDILGTIEFDFKFLNDNHFLQNDVVDIIKTNIKNLHYIICILKELKYSEQLTLDNLKLITQFDDVLIFRLTQLLPLFSEAKLQISAEQLKKICDHQRLNPLVETCTQISKLNSSLLNKITLDSLLSRENNIYSVGTVLALLEKNQLLNQHALNQILSIESVYAVVEVFEILDKKRLLNSNNFKLIMNSNAKWHDFSRDCKTLDGLDLITQDTLALIVEKSLPNTLLEILPTISVFVKQDLKNIGQLSKLGSWQLITFKTVIEQLKKLNLLNEFNFQQVIKLPCAYYEKLFSITNSLNTQGLLNHDSLGKVFLSLGNKLHSPNKSDISVLGTSQTEFRSSDGKLHFCAKYDESLVGGQALIARSTKSLTLKNTPYVVKRLFNVSSEDKIAKRETKYAHLLNRESYYFQNNKNWYVISEWQPGKSLEGIPSSKLTLMPIKKRLESLPHLLKELTQLHQIFRIHGDIKKQNCVLDQNSWKLKLIDFGSSRKVKPKQNAFAHSTDYLDKQRRGLFDPTNHLSFCDDIFALGLVVAELFPEFYKVDLKSSEKTTLIKDTLSTEELAIAYLVSSMLNDKRNERCTSQMALDYCELVLAHFDRINEEMLNDILEITLNKKDISIEDVIHDRTMLPM